MVKRLFDVLFSLAVLIIFSPIFIIVAIAIKLSSQGPVFYVAERAGINGVAIKVFKFRTMNIGSDSAAQITATHDARIFPVGEFLRKSKLDELPQFWNVLSGSMSVVGPRPESLAIVKAHYSTSGYMDTLSVKPGIASPGSLFNYTHSHLYLDDSDPEGSYVNKLLPVKLALENVYIKNANILYDINVILRTCWVITLIILRVENIPLPKEYEEAQILGFLKENQVEVSPS